MCLLQKTFAVFPGRVHAITAMQNEVTVLADRVVGSSPLPGEESKDIVDGPQVYVLTDTVQNPESPVMHLNLKKVEGINEPVSLIASAGFAVGAFSNQVYVWHVDYELPEEQVARLDGVEEEEKSNMA